MRIKLHSKSSLLIFGAIGVFSAFTIMDQKKGYNKENLDTSAKPCEDFYTYAIGGWQKNNPIPSTESRWGVFNILAKDNEAKIENIIDELVTTGGYAKNTPEQQVRDFYLSLMDTTKREKLAMAPLRPYLEQLDTVKNRAGLTNLMAEWQPMGISSFFNFYVSSDAKNSAMNVMHLSQGGLHLPDVDYYTKSDSASVAIRAAYEKHIEKMLTLSGMKPDDAHEAGMEILALEIEIAKKSMTRVERRDPEKTYNLYSRAEFLKTFHGINWEAYFVQAEMPEWTTIIVNQPDFIENTAEMWNTYPFEVCKMYLRWELVNEFSGSLYSSLEEENHRFYAGVLRGVNEMNPTKERSVKRVNGALGELVGKLYVAKHFSEASKNQVSQMVEEIRQVFRERIEKLDWMSDTTKIKAKAKLNAFKYKIGYPDTWKDYSEVNIDSNNLVGNIMALRRFSYKLMMEKTDKPVDKSEWGMTPQTVNAYYSSSKNEIVFPAGILQPPFFDPEAEDALNYGGIGAVIGHEFSHGFDDKGSKYDAIGNLNNWWTDADRIRFEARTQLIVNQFNAYEVLPGVHINGSLTQGENIADLAGLTLAYHALERHYGNNAPKGKGVDGFTWQQRFFLGWSQVWAQNMKEQELRNRILTDPHSPGQYRVIGPLSNLQEFWDAFGCKEGNPMVDKDPETRVVIW